MPPTLTTLSSRTAIADPGPHAVPAHGGPRSPLRFGGDDIVKKVKLYIAVSSRTAKPIRDLVPQKRKQVPALRYRSGGDDIV
ncbi:hypothetical protein PbB2_03089 [Candidatus Phycosocius bacilliformis]|uniref:Uncharacterized protein n=1 Tax=Candidatus Phycosocius bacilliformis TaxID=1445552 RepID=A0A2P2EEA2_9PROT|nr:hypothetical protein PbB2_03089 [Candidatus Phycosocius bacilliformis]